MTKKKDKEVNQPDGAIIAPSESKTPVSEEVLSHQYQENSPALNTNVLAGYETENLVEKDRAAEAAAEEVAKKKDVLTQEEYDRRTKLGVEDKDYINPSTDHFTIKG